MSNSNKLEIQVLVDDPSSWIIPYAEQLVELLNNLGHIVKFLNLQSDVTKGDILFLLGCTKIFKNLHLNKHNLVVHESDLPKGKGWSPLSWQILEGKNEIPIVLLEAVEKVDAGPIYFKDLLKFKGHELVNELRDLQGKKTIELALKFVNSYPDITPHQQTGESSFYSRRTSQNSKIDISKSIEEQFNLLRIVDNDKYPAFFEYKKNKYLIKVYKENETD